MPKNRISSKEKHPRKKELASLPKESNYKKDLAIQGHAERARVEGFIQAGYLPHIFTLEERYSDIVDRLWNLFQCDHVRETRDPKSTYEKWLWIFDRWCGITEEFWKGCSPISHLPLYDFETRELKKERYGGRSDQDTVMLVDLRERIENISKNLSIDFPPPSLLFPEAQEGKRITGGDKPARFTCSDDFRCINKDGKDYPLTTKQAGAIEALYNAYQMGTPEISENHILERAGSKSEHSGALKDLFKRNKEAFENLIMGGKRRGLFRLKI